MAEQRITGIVKWFDADKGYGFIAPDNGSNDVFVHWSGIETHNGWRLDLKDNDRVRFAIEHDQKGPRAENVIPV